MIHRNVKAVAFGELGELSCWLSVSWSNNETSRDSAPDISLNISGL